MVTPSVPLPLPERQLELRPTLFLTGATGFVGSELLRLCLAAQLHCRIAVLSRNPQKLAAFRAHGNVVIFCGDITRPYLGLDSRTFGELTESITSIIHCAADTRFTLPLPEARAVNTEGTRNLLHFAKCCPRLEKFAHVSTVYVAGKAEGCFAEGPICHQSGYCSTYQQSKHEAEELVMNAMNYLPLCIFRLSSILGEARTGVVRQFNYVHQLIRLFPRNALPVIPGLADAKMDLIASDWALPALAFIFNSGFAPGSFYHICAGPDYSLTTAEIMEAMLALFESHPKARRWLPIHPPKMVRLSQYEEFVQQSRLNGDALLREIVRALGYFLPHLAIPQAFDNQKTLTALKPLHLQLPPITSFFEKVVRYCLDTNWGEGIPCAI